MRNYIKKKEISNVDKVNVKSLTNNKVRTKKLKKATNKRIKLIYELNNQIKYLCNSILKVYLYLLLHEKIIYNIFFSKLIDFDFLINAYTSKLDLIHSIETLLLTKINDFLYNHIISQNKTNKYYLTYKETHLKKFYNDFIFKGLLINNFFMYYNNLNLFFDNINNHNFFFIIFEYLYLLIRMRHTNFVYHFLITNNDILINNKIYNNNNIYERYYNYINYLKIYLYNKQNNNYNVTLKYNIFNITPYKMFDTNYFIINTSIRKNFNYDISPLYICLLTSYINKKRTKLIINMICLLYI